MEHSFRFGKTVKDLFDVDYTASATPYADYRHSYEDWFLIPEERFMVAPAEVKSTTIDIPASNRVLDLTETLTGASTFNSIEGTLNFYIDNEKLLTTLSYGAYTNNKYEIFWVELYRDICAFLHGKVRYMMIEDDPQWIYKGRFSVGKYDASDGKWSQIEISYILEPFKRLPWRTDGNWYFDSLNLNTFRPGTTGVNYYLRTIDLMNEMTDILVDSDDWVQITGFRCGEEPVVPTIHVKEAVGGGHLELKFTNDEIGISDYTVTMSPKDGESTEFDFYDRQIIFTNYNHNFYSGYDDVSGLFKVWVKGHGKVSFNYDIGVI